MNDPKIHEDIGSLKEFKDWAKAEFDRLHDKIDSAMAFKWKLIGASSVVSVVVSLVAEYCYIKHGG